MCTRPAIIQGMSHVLAREMIRSSLSSAPLLQIDAVVQWVDPINRVVALATGILVRFYAHPGCPIVLRGEKRLPFLPGIFR